MKQVIGGMFLYNIVIIFLLLVFGFLIGMVSYNKAYKVNTRIADYIEKYEGYNDLAKAEINRFLDNMGYERGMERDCSNRNDATLVSSKDSGYCVYEHTAIQKDIDGKSYISYYYYTVTTFLYIDLPYVDRLGVPITSGSEHIYNFDHKPF